MKNLFLLALLLTSSLFVVGCANSGAENRESNVSTIPWNRPQKWEGQGAMGGMGTQ